MKNSKKSFYSQEIVYFNKINRVATKSEVIPQHFLLQICRQLQKRKLPIKKIKEEVIAFSDKAN